MRLIREKGAVAPGKSVTVTTSPNNAEEAKFQMDGVPTYTAVGGEKETTYRNGGEYTFTMPEENTEVKAVYKKLRQGYRLFLPNFNISVIQERTGNRKNPVEDDKGSGSQRKADCLLHQRSASAGNTNSACLHSGCC